MTASHLRVAGLPIAALVIAAVVGCGDGQPARTVVKTQTVTAPATGATGLLTPTENSAVDEAQQVIAAYCAAKADGLSPRSAGLEQSLDTLSETYRKGPLRRWVPRERPERDRTMVAVMEDTIELLRARECSPQHAQKLADVLKQTKGVGG